MWCTFKILLYYIPNNRTIMVLQIRSCGLNSFYPLRVKSSYSGFRSEVQKLKSFAFSGTEKTFCKFKSGFKIPLNVYPEMWFYGIKR